METRNLKIINGYQREIVKEDGKVISISAIRISSNVDKKFAEKMVEEINNAQSN